MAHTDFEQQVVKIKENLHAVQEKMAQASQRSGRPLADIKLGQSQNYYLWKRFKRVFRLV